MDLKHENQIRLAKEASANCRNGGASALGKVNRLKRMGGGWDADQIVSRVYTHPAGRATSACRECGQEYVDPDDASTCCREEGA